MTAGVSRATLQKLLELRADRVKAFLIIVVVADHNDWLRQLAPNLFEPLTFHVLGFFLLAFSFGARNLSIGFVADRVARYLVPYWWALTAASLAYFFMYQVRMSPWDGLQTWILAAFIGNAPFVKAASGLMMLWFLPSLFGLSCLLALFHSLRSAPARHLAVASALAAHLLIPLLPRPAMLCVPFGLAVVGSSFFLGFVWKQLLNLRLPRLWGAGACVVFIGSFAALVGGPVHLEIATLDLAGMDRPRVLLLQDIAGIAGVLSVVWLSGFRWLPKWLDAIGRHSLLVYLLHPVVYVGLAKLWPSSPKDALLELPLFVDGVLTCAIALGSAYAVSVLLMRSRRLAGWIAPRSWEQWPPARLLISCARPFG